MPANGKPSTGRFELPALTPLKFSLTDGTNIPPPPESPVEEQPPPPAPKPAVAEPVANAVNGHSPAGAANGVYDGRGRTSAADRPPLSPASTKRPSSIRRFLSRKSLNTNYVNGTNTNGSREDLTGIGRPDSPSSFMSGPLLLRKKSGSWFRRFGSHGTGNRTSVVYEDEKKPMGPPPPKLPELNQFKARVEDNDGGSLGADDMFKSIK